MIICISGAAGAGKTTLSRALAARFSNMGILAYEWSFAGPLKDMTKKLLGTASKDAKVTTTYACKGERTISVREFLQVLGTDCIRRYDEGFWVRLAKESAEKARRGDARVVIFDDCRFPDEADIADVHIHINHEGNLSGPEKDHKSESHFAALAQRADVQAYREGSHVWLLHVPSGIRCVSELRITEFMQRLVERLHILEDICDERTGASEDAQRDAGAFRVVQEPHCPPDSFMKEQARDALRAVAQDRIVLAPHPSTGGITDEQARDAVRKAVQERKDREAKYDALMAALARAVSINHPSINQGLDGLSRGRGR